MLQIASLTTSWLMKKNILPFLLFFSVCNLFAQSSPPVEFDLIDVEIEDGQQTMKFYFKALYRGEPLQTIDEKSLQVFEIKDDGQEQKLATASYAQLEPLIDTVDVSREVFHVLFLIDVGKAVSQRELEHSKTIIRTIVNQYILSDSSFYYISLFDNQDLLSYNNGWKKRPLRSNEVGQQLSSIRSTNRDSDIYAALYRHNQTIVEKKGKKVIFLFTNRQTEPISAASYKKVDVLERVILISKEKEDYYLFPVAIGQNPDTDLLESFAGASLQQNDGIGIGALPPKLNSVLENTREYVHTHYIDVTPSESVFDGDVRKFKAVFDNSFTEYLSITRGSRLKPLILQTFPSELWLGFLLVGLLIIVAMFGVFQLGIPILRKRQFEKLYVKIYQPEPKRRITDPLTNQYIRAGEKIVTRCQQVVTLATWESVGSQCPSYPDCMYHQSCAGAGAPETGKRFFSMQGIYRRLNWLWFGAIGGLIGWTLFAATNYFGFSAFQESVVKPIYQAYDTITSADLPTPNLQDLANDTFLGFAFGIGLICMLSWVEERGQARKISWARILVRTLFGSFLTAVLFLLGFYVQFTTNIPSALVNGLIWTLFGAAVGVILSIASSIPLRRGVLGGTLAGVVAFGVYFSINGIAPYQSNFAKLIALLSMGGVLGYILVTVVRSFEEYELEFIAPTAFRRSVPISKWLKNNVELYIGTEAGSYIYIKWNDPAAQPRHARLIYENETVSILPFAETLVNNHIIPLEKKTPLSRGDLIKLGRDSSTQIRFIAKDRHPEFNETNRRQSNLLANTKATLNLNPQKR